MNLLSTSIAVGLACLGASLVYASPRVDPAHCSVSTHFVALEGSDAGTPDNCSDGRCSECLVTVRDFANNVTAGAMVGIDFSPCPDVLLSCDQLVGATGQSYLSAHRIVGTTNAAGQFLFRIQGATNATLPGAETAPGSPAGEPCATIVAEGFPIANLTIAAYDVDGLGSPNAAVNTADVALVAAEALCVLRGGTARARDDYNASGSVNSADAAISTEMALERASGTGSRKTGRFCP